MSIDVKCTGCGAEFTTNDEFAGQMAECPDCGNEIRIPEPGAMELVSDEPAPEAPAAVAVPDIPPPEPKEEEAAPPEKRVPAEQDAAAKLARSRMVEYFRIALIIAVTLAIVKIFDAGIHVVQQRQRYTPKSVVDASVTNVREMKNQALQKPAMAPIARQARYMRDLRALTSFVLLGAMLAMAFRLLLRNKMLDAMWVASPHWNERSLAGVTFYFFTTLVLVGILAWAASVAKVPTAGDGFICGLLAAWLLASSLTALVAHVTSGKEFPHVTGRMVNDMVFGAAILGVLAYGDQIPMPARLTRVSVTSLLVFINFAIEMTLSSVFLLESPAVGRFSRRFGFLLLSAILIGGLGYFLHLVGA